MRSANPIDRARDAFMRAVTHAHVQSRIHATVGWRKSDTEVVINVPGRSNFLYVTTGNTTSVALNRAGVPRQAFLPVWLVRENQTLVIVARDNSDAAALANTPDSDYGVPSHPHALSSLSDVDLTGLADDEMLEWDATAGKWVNTVGGGAVDSVNGQTGAVVLDSDDIAEGATNKYATTANVNTAGAVMETELLGVSSGAGDAGKPIKLDAAGHVDASMINDADINLDNVTEGTSNKFYTSAEKTKLAGIEAGADQTSANGIDDALTALSTKTTPIDADTVLIYDSTTPFLKWLTWANLKATLKTYFDTLYVALTGAQTVAGVKDFTNGIKVANGTTLTHLSSGTFTPLVGGSVLNPTLSGASLGGHYLRINNWCLVHADVSLGTITSAGSGDVRINLPVAAANFNLLQVFWSGVDIPGTPVNVMGITISGQSYLLVAVSQDNAGSVNLQHSGLSSGDAINITGIYQV